MNCGTANLKFIQFVPHPFHLITFELRDYGTGCKLSGCGGDTVHRVGRHPSVGSANTPTSNEGHNASETAKVSVGV